MGQAIRLHKTNPAWRKAPLFEPGAEPVEPAWVAVEQIVIDFKLIGAQIGDVVLDFIEHIFDLGANEVFVVRVAGNVLGLECLGSVDYAVSHLNDSLRTGVVLGHTGCGAVTAAVDMYLAPREFTNLSVRHPVRSLVDRIMLAVRAASRALHEHYGDYDPPQDEYRKQLISTSIYLNAAVTAFDVQREVRDIRGDDVQIAFGVYNVSRSRVSALPLEREDSDSPTFLPAPGSAEEFAALASRVVERLVETEPSRQTVYLS